MDDSGLPAIVFYAGLPVDVLQEKVQGPEPLGETGFQPAPVAARH